MTCVAPTSKLDNVLVLCTYRSMYIDLKVSSSYRPKLLNWLECLSVAHHGTGSSPTADWIKRLGLYTGELFSKSRFTC